MNQSGKPKAFRKETGKAGNQFSHGLDSGFVQPVVRWRKRSTRDRIGRHSHFVELAQIHDSTIVVSPKFVDFDWLLHQASPPLIAKRMTDNSRSEPPHERAIEPTARWDNFTSSERRGTVRRRSAFARKPRPLFRADMFQSWDARRLVRRSAVCPRNRSVFPRPSLE